MSERKGERGRRTGGNERSRRDRKRREIEVEEAAVKKRDGIMSQ